MGGRYVNDPRQWLLWRSRNHDSLILATHPKFIHYAQMHALLTQGSTIDVRIFPDKRAAVAEWLGAPVELLAAESEPDIADEAASGAA
jgi:hypothetical protein